jgi:hypothetical protein
VDYDVIILVCKSPLKKARSGENIWGNSSVCLSGVKLSEFSRVPFFYEHRSEAQRGWFIGGALFGASKKRTKAYELAESKN